MDAKYYCGNILDGNIVDRVIQNAGESDGETIVNGALIDDVITAAERDNAVAIDATGPISIGQVVGGSNISIAEMVQYVAERTRDLLLAENASNTSRTVKTVNTATPAIVEGTVNTVSDAEEPRHDGPPSIDAFRALNDTDDNIGAKIGPINQTMNDSGIAPPTIDSQVLPKPNVTIETLDETSTVADTFEADSDDWFDKEAAKIIQSTPQPLQRQGKVTIDLKNSYYCISTRTWPIECRFQDFELFSKFLKEMIKGPNNTVWYNAPTLPTSGAVSRINRKCYSFIPGNFPNFDFDEYRRQNQITTIEPRMVNSTLEPQAQKRQYWKKKNFRRQNAIDHGDSPKKPNTKNIRLFGRKGSREKSSCDRCSEAIEKEPVELGLQVLRFQKRLTELESKLKK